MAWINYVSTNQLTIKTKTAPIKAIKNISRLLCDELLHKSVLQQKTPPTFVVVLKPVWTHEGEQLRTEYPYLIYSVLVYDFCRI